MYLAAHGFEAVRALYGANTPLWQGLRGFGLGVLDRVPALRRELALAACGYGGEVPALCQRLPIANPPPLLL